jgi:hypothetical protein
MSKFREGDEIVRACMDARWARIGFKAIVLEGNMYLDALGETKDILDEYWELAEDTSKSVYTKLMWQCDELPKIGMMFATEAGEYIAEYTNEKSVCFTDENGFLVAINRGYVKPISAPIELIDGNAYMFDWSDRPMKDSIGVYSLDSQRFYFVSGHVLASYCTNIRPMTVAESK